MNWTGERVIPDVCPAALECTHRQRYAFLDGEVAGKVVLDAPCGAGYGSAMMLGAGAKEVHGLDLAEEAIAWAAPRYPHVAFHVGDFCALPREWELAFDTVVCFEGIEHVDELSGRRALLEFARVLRVGGELWISTPNPQWSKSRVGKEHFHKREYSWKELWGMVTTGGRFKVSGHYGSSGDPAVPIVAVPPEQLQFWKTLLLRAQRTAKDCPR